MGLFCGSIRDDVARVLYVVSRNLYIGGKTVSLYWQYTDDDCGLGADFSVEDLKYLDRCPESDLDNIGELSPLSD